MRRPALLLLLMGLPALAGCGTLADALAGPVDDHHYYRGVRMDLAGIKQGTPIMALDLPLSACVDTLLIPTILYEQVTQPGLKHKSALQATGEAVGNVMVNEVVVPSMNEVMKTSATLSPPTEPTPTPPVILPRD